VPPQPHGPVAALDRGTALWAIAPDRETVLELRGQSGPTVVVAADQNVLELADVAVELPGDTDDWAQALLAVLPAQAAGLWLAERLGVEVDHPHGLHKVTLTR